LLFASKFLNLPQSKIIELVKSKEIVTATKKHYVFYAEELIDFKNFSEMSNSQPREAPGTERTKVKKKKKSLIISQEEMVELAELNS
jgi:hypothetical protein